MSVVSPERYWKELLNEHNPGALEVFVGTDQQCYTPRVAYRREVHGWKQEGILLWMVATLVILLPPVLLYITWRKMLAVLQQVKVTKGGPAVMWACIVWMPLANLYFAAKLIMTTSAGMCTGWSRRVLAVTALKIDSETMSQCMGRSVALRN